MPGSFPQVDDPKGFQADNCHSVFRNFPDISYEFISKGGKKMGFRRISIPCHTYFD